MSRDNKRKKGLWVLIIVSSIGLGIGGYYKVSEYIGNYMLEAMLEAQIKTLLTKEQMPPTNEIVPEIVAHDQTETITNQPNKSKEANEVNKADEAMEEERTLPTSDTMPAQVGPSQEVDDKEAVSDKEEIEDTTKEKDVTLNEAIDTEAIVQQAQAQAEIIAQSIPSKDKHEMTQLVLANVSMADIQYLAKLVSDGVSASDLNEAKQVAYRSFSKEDIERVRMYYYQYSYLIPY